MEIRRQAGNGWLELIIEGRLDGSWADSLDAELQIIQSSGIAVKTVSQALDEMLPQLQ